MLIVEYSSTLKIFFLHFLYDNLELSIFQRRFFLTRDLRSMFSIYVSLEVFIAFENLVTAVALACLGMISLFYVRVEIFL
jgi:hypothetical protein